MSVQFIQERHNADRIRVAAKQQRDLSYFTESSHSKDITQTQINAWISANYTSNDVFLNWVRTLFKEKNFLSFYKYLRYPLASSQLINDDIKPQLERVFHAEDSFKRLLVSGVEITDFDSEKFEKDLFNAILFRYNDIVIHDLDNVGEPIREILKISNVVAIDGENGKISKIAYASSVHDSSGKEIHGYTYIDDKEYSFYTEDYIQLEEFPTIYHELGECPAVFVCEDTLNSDCWIIKKSVFTYCKNELEEYVFLKTLLKMTEPNGALPVVTKLKTTEKNKDSKEDGAPNPMASSVVISSQSPQSQSLSSNNDNVLQAGTQISIPLKPDDAGKYDMNVVKNFLNFHYMPIEALMYVKDRIQEIKQNIIISVTGDYQEQNQAAKNELQVSKSYISKQDKLRLISTTMSSVCQKSDFWSLALKYGPLKVYVERYFGSDFYIETEADLMNLFASAPNPIERKNILIRSSQNRNKYNHRKAKREKILYEILPFTTDAEFQKAIDLNTVSNEAKVLYNQFNYYVGLFESKYGDIVSFFDGINAEDNQRYQAIKSLISDLIAEEIKSLNQV